MSLIPDDFFARMEDRINNAAKILAHLAGKDPNENQARDPSAAPIPAWQNYLDEAKKFVTVLYLHDVEPAVEQAEKSIAGDVQSEIAKAAPGIEAAADAVIGALEGTGEKAADPAAAPPPSEPPPAQPAA